MPRATNQVASRKRRKKILKAAKGYRGGRSKLLKTAKESVHKALQYAYRDRRQRKREFRRLWITRINAAAREHGMSYSEFIHAMKKSNIDISRNILADLAVREPEIFTSLVNEVKSAG
ncbi:50S ribosomal protein L20 [candidate division KSB1 bacterium]